MLALSRYIPTSRSKAQVDRKKLLLALRFTKPGVVGLGKIGSHVANVAKAMGMKLLAYDFISTERAEQLHSVALVEMDMLLQEADYIISNIPKTPETTHLINAAI